MQSAVKKPKIRINFDKDEAMGRPLTLCLKYSPDLIYSFWVMQILPKITKYYFWTHDLDPEDWAKGKLHLQ